MRWMRAVAVSLSTLLVADAVQAASVREEARAYRIAHEKQIVADFMELLALPNVATNVPDVERNATYIEGQLKARGFKTRILRAEPGTPPAVFAELETPAARRTVLFYAHYDGQPVSQKAWISDPIW